MHFDLKIHCFESGKPKISAGVVGRRFKLYALEYTNPHCHRTRIAMLITACRTNHKEWTTVNRMYERWLLQADLDPEKTGLYTVILSPLLLLNRRRTRAAHLRMCPGAHHISKVSHYLHSDSSRTHPTSSFAGSSDPNATACETNI